MGVRPRSVTIICWILIITGGISLVTTMRNLNDLAFRAFRAGSLLPLNVEYHIMRAGLLVTILCGIAMLKRQNWARFLYVGWGVVNFVIALAASPMKAFMIPNLVVFVVIAFFLFGPKANEYFREAPTAGHGT